METPLVLQVIVFLALCLQVAATIYAIRLVRRTKYSAIWILCIIGFVLIVAERYFELKTIEVDSIYGYISIALGIAVSICVSCAVLFANKLVNYLDRVENQRALFNKHLLTAALRGEERSRHLFSKELHDGMGPLLSSAKMSLSALSQDDLTEEQREIVNNTTYVIEESIRSLREISNNLSPQVLLDFGLAQAVKNFIERCVALHSIDINFATTLRNERFDTDVEVVIYRVVCELINNSLKHSQASQIDISLALEQNNIILDYADNGCGFEPKAMMYKGMGLSNISSRIDTLGGVVDIVSSSGNGMNAHIDININSESK